MDDVFGFMVFGGGFPVSEGVEVDLVEAWVGKLEGGSFAELLECILHAVFFRLEYVVAVLWELVKHVDKRRADG